MGSERQLARRSMYHNRALYHNRVVKIPHNLLNTLYEEPEKRSSKITNIKKQ